jgi:signal transduction histidine kinase
LIQSEKLASIGQLAAGVAHELNNPLANISLNTEMLMRNCKDEVSAKKLNVIAENVDQAARIVRDLLDFSREAKLELEFLDVNEVLVKALESLKYEIRDIKIVDNLDPNLPRVLGDRVRLKQVFTNIISNALHAMDNGGVLSISTRADKKFLEVRISDTGRGIPKEHLGKIFDPFFTTKGVGKGTGLGLAISYSIVEKHGGLIEVESEVGKGTTFIIKIPTRKK